MSRGCYKAYGRKVGPTTHVSIQFDKLLRENSNKPCAAKSAGTVGKWGVTSFTSIRSTSFTVGKRPRDKGTKNNNVAKTGDEPSAPAEVKPKKFFKSRTDEKPKHLPPAPPSPASTPASLPSLAKQYSRPPPSSTKSPRRHSSPPPPRQPKSPAPPPPPRSPSRPTRLASIVAARKLVDTLENEELEDELFQSGAINLSSPLLVRPPSPPGPPARRSPSPPPPTSPVHPEEEARQSGEEEEEEEAPAAAPPPPHPPIVLRICKGTAKIITPLLEDDHEQTTKEATNTSSHGSSKRESRRRSYGSDSNDSAPTPPKKHKKHKEQQQQKETAEREEELRKLQELKATLEDDEPLTTTTDIPPIAESKESMETDEMCEEHSEVPEPSSHGAEEVKKEECLVVDESSPQEPLHHHSEPLPLTEPPQQDEGKLDFKEDSNSDGETGQVYSEPPLTSASSQETIQRVEPLVLRRPTSGKPAKKGSIFKSRGATGEKRNAHYIHKWCDQKDEAAGGKPGGPDKAATGLQTPLAAEFEAETTLTRVTSYTDEAASEEAEPITSVTCSKKAKEFYTVVRNVKKAHQIQESGEFQEFNDDVEYILDALQDNNPISTRCLSAITLASKCMVPAFRMHVRAHGTVTKFFRALHDATKDQRLGMCTATVMFVLSQDRLNMDIERDSLELMLSLLESDASHSSALEGCGLSTLELKKTKDRVRELCQEIQEQGHAKYLNLDNITVGQLAMETLLSLTSKRAGEWFKEELRDLGGLEHIIKTVVETCAPLSLDLADWTPPLLDRLRKADRCLRVLENVTLQNEANNNYLLTYGDGILVDTVVRMLRVCGSHIPFHPTRSLADKESPGAVIRECMIANLKVLINLTHDFNNKSFGSTLAGMREGLIESSLHLLLEIPRYIPEEQKFDLFVLTLILLINLVEHCQANRTLLIQAKAPPRHDTMFAVDGGSAVAALVGMFLEQEELARTMERKTDAILDGEKQPDQESSGSVSKSTEEFIEETVALLLQKAGRHMEHTLIGAYIALLLGYLIVENQEFEEYVRSHMPNNNYEMLLSVLQKFYNFMMLTSSAGSGSSRGIKATELLIKQLTEIERAISNAPPTSLGQQATDLSVATDYSMATMNSSS